MPELHQCKQHERIIQQLKKQNSTLKENYNNLLKEHQVLLEKYEKLAGNKEVSQEVYLDESNQYNKASDLDSKFTFNSRFSHNFDNQISFGAFDDVMDLSLKQQKDLGKDIINLSTDLDKTNQLRVSRSSSKSSFYAEKPFSLIEGSFILEKKKQGSKAGATQMLEFIYPEQLRKTEKQGLQMLIKYAFTSDKIIRVDDDQCNSRRNEILFGTPFQDYTFAFQDGKWSNKREVPQLLKSMGTMKKKYFHILTKPEIIEKEEYQEKQEKEQQGIRELKKEEQQNYFYETEVIFGFISSFPLRVFFQDLHRTIQQEQKYWQLIKIQKQKAQEEEVGLERKKKYSTIGQIMKSLYDRKYKASKFPIEVQYNTGVTQIQLQIPNVQSYRQMEDQFLNHALTKYSNSKICLLLHLVLAEKCIFLQASDHKSLNELFEIIRILIRPFLWIFALVYVYSDYFEPFLSSPMPIIIGKVSDSSMASKSNISNRVSLDYSQFNYIKMDSQEIEIKESDQFHKVVKKLRKQLQKGEKEKKETKATILHSYVNSLKTFIEKGILNIQPTDFHIEFMDTQMVSYYKQGLEI